MDIKEIEVNPTPAVVEAQRLIWRCGDLRTGTIAVGLTSLVSSILLPAYYVETYLRDGSFSIEIIVVLLVALFLSASDCALIYGATKRYPWFIMPWVGLHSLLQLFLVAYLSFKYSELRGSRAVMLISFGLMLYFIAVVSLFYRQLKVQEKHDQVQEVDGVEAAKATTGPRCLIDLENGGAAGDEENPPTEPKSKNNPFLVDDDTFSEIADRSAATVDRPAAGNLYVSLIGSPQNPTLDDSGEFTLPTSAAETTGDRSFSFPLSESFLLNGPPEKPLPTPDEVIELRETNNPFLGRKKSAAKSAVNIRSGEEAEDEHQSSMAPLIPASSEPHVSRPKASSKSAVDMNLVDAFSPYRKKQQQQAAASSAEALPKMKIFLPKSDDESSSDSSSSAEGGGP